MDNKDSPVRDNSPDEIVLISSLNQFVFCPRRCYLMGAEGVFADNLYTVEGTIMHEIADIPGIEKRKGVRIVRALPLYCDRLGLQGKGDVVEFYRQEDGTEIPYPVEYKRGPKKKWVNDDVQLCAQALCLEAMFKVLVPLGAVFHGQTKRRREVEFTAELRKQTEESILQVRTLLGGNVVPPAKLHPKCEGCSIHSFCMPELIADPEKVDKAHRSLFEGG